jgi:hypothetical protein
LNLDPESLLNPNQIQEFHDKKKILVDQHEGFLSSKASYSFPERTSSFFTGAAIFAFLDLVPQTLSDPDQLQTSRPPCKKK